LRNHGGHLGDSGIDLLGDLGSAERIGRMRCCRKDEPADDRATHGTRTCNSRLSSKTG
jgi:hypothetical protein